MTKKEQLKALAEELRKLFKDNMSDEETRAFDAKKSEYEKLKKEILDDDEKEKKASETRSFMDSLKDDETRGTSTPNKPIVHAEPRDHSTHLRLFKNVGEQLKAIRQFALTGNMDERLHKINKEERAASGMNEGNLSEGGFALQMDFGGLIMDSAVQTGQILSRCDSYECSANSAGVKWVDIDEETVSGSVVFGGVQVYWANEAATVTASKPQLKERKLELEKLMGLAYATDEMMEDTNFITDLYTRAFTAGIIRKAESAIVAGTGVGQPQGVIGSAARVTVAKENGQAADTVLWNNISKMFNRRLVLPNSQFAWLVHPDVREQFDFMNFPVGAGGVPVYLQETKAGELASLKGIPIVETDLCSAVGDEGDIALVDLANYIVARKGGIKSATSIHVLFTTGEQAFRFTFRMNGAPKAKTALTINNSTNKRASIVTLAAR